VKGGRAMWLFCLIMAILIYATMKSF
jgi:hypothetical protein